ncbi:MAG: DUF4430 domain-containing protein [Candidatus Nomurabacteria bacterium]|nr:DUF4430 domain-containing protein [Candidatus Nomurabacteria bacterium]
MKNILKKSIVLTSLVFVFFVYNFTFADNDPATDTAVPDTSFNIIIKDNCTAIDTNGINHIFPDESSPSKFLGICALVAAQEAKYIDSFELINDPSMGLYVKSINNIVPSATEYWALWVNGGYANCGIGCLPVVANDKLSFILSDWSAGTESTKILLNISALESSVLDVVPSVSVHLKIISGTNSLLDKDMSVTACDSDNDKSTPDTITAYCSVLQSGLKSNWNWAWAPGAFVDSIGDIAGYTNKDSSNNDVYHYWSWSSNGNVGMTGLNEYIPKENDVILLEFIDPQTEVVAPESGGNGGGSGYVPVDKVFSVLNALNFLSSNQNSDGSFSSSMYTDWVAIAASAGNSPTLKSSISNYLKSNPIVSSSITDYERRAMSLMALGVNPYNGTSVNYINKIISSFDKTQIGDSSLFNDDVFGLIVLQNAGYTQNDEIINKTISFIIKNQFSNGSWGSVDMTSAAIESLNNFKSISGVSEAISKGELYLISEQKNDGSFGNQSSTSWAIQALSLNTTYNTQIEKSIKYLANDQHIDGGVNSSDTIINRIWSTSYAVPAVLKLSWNNILQSFSKEEDIKTTGTEQQDKIATDVYLDKDALKSESDKNNKSFDIKEEKVSTIKITEIKKAKIPKKIVDKKIIKITNSNNNLLSASADGSTQDPNTFFSIIHKIVIKIKAPFSWLWYRLGF